MKNWKIILSIFGGLLMGLWLFGPILFHRSEDFTKKWISKKIPEGNVFIKAGESVSVTSLLDGDKNIISFWGTWCGPCVNEMPRIDQNFQELKKGGINLRLFSYEQGIPDKIEAEIKAWLISRRLLNIQTLFDFNGDYMDKLELPSLPVHIGLNKEGKILWIEEGEIDWTLADIQKRF